MKPFKKDKKKINPTLYKILCWIEDIIMTIFFVIGLILIASEPVHGVNDGQILIYKLLGFIILIVVYIIELKDKE